MSSTLNIQSNDVSWVERALPIILAFLAFIAFARADDISVSAALSAATTTTDQPVNLTVTVTGGMSADIPSEIQAEGLDIEYRGQSRRIEMMNFRGSISVVNTYVVSPRGPGKFTIPPIEIVAGGKTYKTDPLTLTVTKGNAAASGTADSTAPKIYAELIIPKDTAYVGEIIPAEVRFYFDGDIQFQVNPPGQVPQIAGEGFSKQRYPQPRVEQTDIKGRPYRVLIYKTSIVAAKAGDLDVGPAELLFVVSMPQSQQRQRRSIFDDPFADDIFSNSLFNQRIEREMNVRSDPVKIKVKALPPGKPPGFTGAVGQFTLQATAQPDKVKIGDPVTLTSVISGRGNFDLVSAPTLIEAENWQAYPPTGRLSSNEELGVTRDKTFTMAIIPKGPAKEVPPVEFSYFDPAQEKYITLRTEPIAIQVEGNAVVATARPTPVIAPDAPAVPTATPAGPANDLLPIATTLDGKPQTFTPVWEQPVFWLAQGVPLLLLLGLAGPRLIARLQPDAATRQKRVWQGEMKRCENGLRSDKPEEFFPAAARILELEAILKTGKSPGSVDEVLIELGHEGEEAEMVREIFRRRDELAYGGGRGGRELSAEARQRYESVLPKGGGR